MKEQILTKIKDIIINSSEEHPKKGEIIIKVEKFDRIFEEIDVILGFFEKETQQRTLDKVVDEAKKNIDYVNNVVENIKDEEEKLEKFEKTR